MNTIKASSLCAMMLLLILSATAFAQVNDPVEEQRQKDGVVITRSPLRGRGSKGVQPKGDEPNATPTGADVTIGSGVTVTLGSDIYMSLGGNFTNNGTVTAQTGSFVDFDGTGDQTLSGATTFFDLGKPAGGTLTLNSPVTVNGALFLDGGQINNSTNPLVLASGARLYRTGGTISNPPTFSGPVDLVYDQSSPIITTGPELPTSSTDLRNLRIDGAGITLGASATPTVNGTLYLYDGNIKLGSRNLTLAPGALIVDPSDTSYVETNGTGVFTYKSVGATEKLFPIGWTTSYTPVRIINAGATDDFSARVDTTFTPSPSQPTKVVKRQWTITEAVLGGSNATLKFQWNASDQGSGFSTGDPNQIVVGRYNGTKWVEQTASFTPSPLTATATGVTSFSPFAVGNTNALRTVTLANLKFLLEGPFNAGTNLMNNSLRATLLPAQFPGKPIPALAVDSVQIEIRGTSGGVLGPTAVRVTRVEVADALQEKTPQSEDAVAAPVSEKQRRIHKEMTPAADDMELAVELPKSLSDLPPNPKVSQPAWLLTNGTILNFTDTTKSFVEFDTASATNYWRVVVRHRNHLAIMTRDSILLTSTNPALYNFTTDTSKAFGTAPMKQVSPGVFAMWAGDVTGDGELKYNGPGNDRALILQRIGGININNTVPGYYNEDVNMNGIVMYNGSGNDRAIILVNIGGININATRRTPVP